MKIATVIQRNPLVLLLAVAAAAVMLFISEGSYWRSAGTLDALGTMAAARSSLQDIERGLRDAQDGEECARGERARGSDVHGEGS